MMLTKYSLKTTVITALAAMMVGCSNSYPGEIFDLKKDPSVFNNETSNAEKSAQPIKIFINEQDFFTVSTTRGTGPFDKDDPIQRNHFANSNFYIFAFRKGKYVQGSDADLTSDTDFRRTAYAGDQMPGQSDPKKKHCLLDGLDYYAGLPMKLNVDGSGELKYYIFEKSENGSVNNLVTDMTKYTDMTKLRDSLFYYSPDYQDLPYDFFSYYVDDFVPNSTNTHREADRIYHDITIDGSQDIMCGMADPLDSLIQAFQSHPESFAKNSPLKALSITDQFKLMSVGGYCAYAAHRGIDPQVKMTHQLARLKFFAHPGDESCDSITITKIEVRCPNSGQLTVASRDVKVHPLGFQWSPTNGSVFLKEPSVDGFTPCEDLKPIKIEWNPAEADKNWYYRKAHEIGGSLMVPPAEEYDLCLYFTQKQPIQYGGKDTRDVEYQANYKITLANKNDRFKAGIVYPVHIGVYGLQEIKVSTWVQGWEQAPDNAVTPIDPDAEIIE